METATTEQRETRVYRKGEVWLCKWSDDIKPLAILEVKGNYIRHKYGWESGEEWHKRAKQKLGRVRRFLGIPIGIARTP